MTDDLHYVKGLTRFNYWTYPAINQLLAQRSSRFDPPPDLGTVTHRNLSSKYQKAHQAGDAQAIFQYVKVDVWAFRARWVVQQIEDWRREDTDESRKKLHRLMRMYTDDRGRDSPRDTVCLIKRDQAIFKEIINLRQGENRRFRLSGHGVGCYELVAEKYSLIHAADDLASFLSYPLVQFL
jgi:hypothetical protein